MSHRNASVFRRIRVADDPLGIERGTTVDMSYPMTGAEEPSVSALPLHLTDRWHFSAVD
jgi:hypothetical protein